jgi:hypothetical protein
LGNPNCGTRQLSSSSLDNTHCHHEHELLLELHSCCIPLH